ncbi:hypothetical protein GCM10008904_07540 [Paraclostridium ghonii]|uniref:DUF2232 domain-containing protein n=1 Tax=Paraclostridium ghonii TaxID=29358 RepID=A0ABU0N2U5_9FIRM|nr:hypothetical protein [Paeniclostridium ghonii]MDQ0557489.1 hypothetical protein [Paeniclostridium ghonii]
MSRKIAYSGILLAVNIILLILSNIIPINTLFFMGLASLVVSIVIMEYGGKFGVLFCLASILLSFFIIANKVQWITYVFTFGIYGLIKYLIEKNRNIYLELILKLFFANLVMAGLYIFLKAFVFISLNLFTIVGFQIAFIVYDYVYTLFIDYYETKIKNILKIR